MKLQPFALLALAALLAFASLADAEALVTDTGCGNYGTIVRVGSADTCNGAQCSNFGVVVDVASAPRCAGYCPNDGILVNVAGSYCGDPKTLQVCDGQTCYPPRPDSPSTAVYVDSLAGGCFYSVGNCTGGYCTFSLAGACNHGGNCWLNTAGVCQNDCLINAVAVCTRNCLVNVLNVCFKEVPI